MVIVECRSVFASILLFFYLSEVEEQPIHQLQDGNIEPHFMHQRHFYTIYRKNCQIPNDL